MSKELTRARITEKWLFGEFELAEELRHCIKENASALAAFRDRLAIRLSGHIRSD